MGITMPIANALLAPLQDLLTWLLRPIDGAPATKTIASPPRGAGVAGPNHAQRPAVRSIARPTRPLRVLRVVDGPQPPADAGRMVISGRMADVCAELDRLAAQETASR